MTTGPWIIRDATEADLSAMVEIYNQVIATTDAIWLDEPIDLADHLTWYRSQVASRHPTIVAVDADGHVLGYASFAGFRTKAGYWPTVEHTIHLHVDHRGRGIGQALLDELVVRAGALGKHVMVAGIDGGNHGSIRFHERNGFRVVGTLPGVGRRGERPVDLVLMQRELHGSS